MEDNNHSFENSDAAAEYYKQLALDYRQKLEDLQHELEEYEESSRELEAELETQLEQFENRAKDLRTENCHLKRQYERLQEKFEKAQEENHLQVTSLEEELAQTTLVKDEYQEYIRKLEQVNDDLERAVRATYMSLEDSEGKLNQAIEKNAILENELDDKDRMTTVIQRLKDEARDLKQELHIQETVVNSNNKRELPSKDSKPEKILDSNKHRADGETQTRTRIRRVHLKNNMPSKIAVPNSSVTIVGDLFKKIGILETKLQSCRKSAKDPDRLTEDKASSPLTSPSRAKTLSSSSRISPPQDYIHLTA